jgi:hypothetical protein
MEQTPQQKEAAILASVQANPKLANDPNTIKMYQSAGGTLSNYAIPKVQQTTTPMRYESQSNNIKLNERLAGMANAGANQGTTSTTVTNETDNGDGTKTVQYSDGTKKSVTVTKNPDGTEKYTDSNSMGDQNGIMSGLQTDINSATSRSKAQIEYATTTLDSIKAQSSLATNALIDSIKKTYAAKMKLMEESNTRMLGAKNVAGQVSGRSRYANEIQQGVISDEEQAGISRIAQLEGNMLSLIADAESARTKDERALFNDRMAALDKADDNLRLEVQNLQKTAFDKLQLLQTQEKNRQSYEKQQFEQSLDLSKRSAPGVMEAMKNFKTPQEQSKFLESYSKKMNIPLDVLLGDMEAQSKLDTKSALDIENIQNTITNRNRTTDISASRLAMEKKKETFNPTQAEKSKVMQYLSQNGSDKDSAKANEDPDFFYYILGLVSKSEE